MSTRNSVFMRVYQLYCSQKQVIPQPTISWQLHHHFDHPAATRCSYNSSMPVQLLVVVVIAELLPCKPQGPLTIGATKLLHVSCSTATASGTHIWVATVMKDVFDTEKWWRR